MPDNTTKNNVGIHKALTYNECVSDLFTNSTMASTARKSPRGPIKKVWYTHIETSKYPGDVYVEAVY